MLGFLLAFVCASDEPKYHFGDPTKRLEAKTLQNHHLKIEVIRNCFGPHIDGSTDYILDNNVLLFQENHSSIEVSDVFIQPEEQRLFEIVQIIDGQTFTVEPIDVLEVFSKIQLKTQWLIHPNEFEGMVNLEITSLGVALLEYEVSPTEELFFVYNTAKNATEYGLHHPIFALEVDIIGFRLALDVHYDTHVSVIPINCSMSEDFEYTRNFHHETSIHGLINSYAQSSQPIVSSRSHAKKYYIDHRKCSVLTGVRAEFNVSIESDMVFAAAIGRDETSLKITNKHVIHNVFVPGYWQNNTLEYDISMTTSRNLAKFTIGDQVLWPPFISGATTITVPQPAQRIETVRNVSLLALTKEELFRQDPVQCLLPFRIECNDTTKLLIRFDVTYQDSVNDSLLLEPLTFSAGLNRIDQERLMILPQLENIGIKILLRDLNSGLAEYIPCSFPIIEGTYEVWNANKSVCVHLEIIEAYHVFADHYYAADPKVKYVYFNPSESEKLGDGFSLIRVSGDRYFANSHRDVLHTPAVFSNGDQGVFWNWLTFDLSFVSIELAEDVKTLSLSINVNRGSSHLQNVYEMSFLHGTMIDRYDRVVFQMTHALDLQIYATITDIQGIESSFLFKFSYQQVVAMIGNQAEFPLNGCNIVLTVNTKEIWPVVSTSNVTSFVISPVCDSMTSYAVPKSVFTILRYEFSDMKSSGPLPYLKALFQINGTVLANMWTIEKTSIVDLHPNANVKFYQKTLVVSIPVFLFYEVITGFDDLYLFASSENGYCDRYESISSTGLFDVGCIEVHSNLGLQIWFPVSLSYSTYTRELGPITNLSIVRMTTPVHVFNCSLRNLRTFPLMTTVLNLDDTVHHFSSVYLRCERCSSLEVQGKIIVPETSDASLFSIPSSDLPSNIYAQCVSSIAAHCISEIEFLSTTLVTYPSVLGIESFTPNVKTEIGVFHEVFSQSVLNFSKKSSGSVTGVLIEEAVNLSLVIEVRTDNSVVLKGYADPRMIPFSATNLVAGKREFLAELGLKKGSFQPDGCIIGDFDTFMQPQLGVFDIENYSEINLTRIYGFKHDGFQRFIVRCSEESEESEDGKCLPVSVWTSAVFTASQPWTASGGEMPTNIIIIGSTIAGAILLAVAIGIVVFMRRKRKTEISASEIIEKHLLEDCSFAV